MATIDLIPVVIYYSVTPEHVEVRVRTYAGTVAIREETQTIAHGDLKVQAQKSGRADFAPEDVVALVPDAKWGGDPAVSALRADILT